MLIAIGMRFDDRVTSDINTYAKQAKVIHIDIDPSEIGKNVPANIGILGNAKDVLQKLIPMLEKREFKQWSNEFDELNEIENQKVIIPETLPTDGDLNMGEVVAKVSELTNNNAIIVTDVGQNQMMAARYSKFNNTRSFVSSGGLGTMGFGLPAAIGAKIASPDKHVCFFTGDGGIPMTIQELGTILQENTGVKIMIFHISWLGMVR